MANTPVVSIERAREHIENAKFRNIGRIQADTQERKVLLAGMHEVNKLLTDLEVSREKVDALAARGAAGRGEEGDGGGMKWG